VAASRQSKVAGVKKGIWCLDVLRVADKDLVICAAEAS
jgi:hypothetical protein